ncbi:hypothetical protein VTL71DRAFT_16344 [Oculimacula yallundae]|uniref:SAC3/GANP/THP3 conserved domain-containing protein n=1 Tax=Oculimacula yallundae TaxID=86028 RepID=A0ABR4CE58_9HELO
MLLGRQGSNTNRRANRSSRGRGQDSMSRGASNSSSTASTPNAFEKERLENAAKRSEREKGAMANERGGRGRGGKEPFRKSPSPTTNPSFAQAPVAASTSFGSASLTPFNPFAPKSKSPLGTHSSTVSSNPFGTPPKSEAVNPFGKPAGTAFGAPSVIDTPTNSFNSPSSNPNPFGASSNPEVGANSFGSSSFGATPTTEATTSHNDKQNSAVNPFGAPSKPAAMPATSSVFGASSSNPWSKPSSGGFGTQSTPSPFTGAGTNGNSMSESPAQSKPSPFGTPSNGSFSGLPSNTTDAFGSLAANSTSPFGATNNAFGASNGISTSAGVFAKPSTNGALSKPSPVHAAKQAAISTAPMLYKSTSSFGSPAVTKPAANSLAAKVEQQLKKDRISPPSMPAYDLMYERQLLSVPEILRHVQEYKAYQEKVRSSLMKAGLIDDPDKPKSLKDAIDFKGTCEDMCPQLEKIERLSEGRVDVSEKGLQADGTPTRHAVMEKMVKILARSSAGQAAPLPSEVRTTAALRRTVDYLMKDLLTEENISKVHGFLWNRTRAIRRDFVFHSFMSPPELVDQVYCLETIARFHTISLHLMSKPENYSETFDTHQEFEQLGNTMISLMQAYGDCKANGVVCQNEAEFRAYLVLIQRKSNPGLLEMVHSWGWDLFEAKEVKIALAMAEALGNTWDMHGPLKPTAPTDIAQNAFSRFFDIIKDKDTSYTMACFAEIWFNDAREAILRTILASYRKQRNQVKDWTVPVLNEYLRFDDESDIIPWCEARDVVFEEADGLTYLSMEPSNVLNHIEGKQYHSYPYVERKRGSHSLQHVLYTTVYEGLDSKSTSGNDDEEEGLFVKQANPFPKPNDKGTPFSFGLSSSQGVNQTPASTNGFSPPAEVTQVKSTSLFDRVGNPETTNGFPGFHSTASQPITQPNAPEPKPTSMFASQPTNGVPSTSADQPAAQYPTSFLQAPAVDTPSFPPVQPANGPSSFFPKQQTGGQSLGFSKPSSGSATAATKPVSPLKEPPGNQPASASVALSSPFSTGTSATAPTDAAKAVSFFPQQQLSNPPPPANSSALSETFTQSQPHANEQAFPATPATPTPPVASQSLLSGGSLLLSNTPKESPGAPVFQSAPATQQEPTSVAQQPPVDRFAGFTDWFVFGTEGIIEQFTVFQVENIISAATKQFVEEETLRLTKEAEESARAEADTFRYRSLATKYGYLWREQARLKWLKRRGREARKARREMAESFRASKAAQSEAVVEDFRASTTNQRKGSLESIFGAASHMNEVHDTGSEVQALVRADHKSPHKRQKSQRSERSTTSQSSTASKHKRGRSDAPLRRSLMSDPTYLQGGSRIHLMSDRNIRDEQSRPQISGVQTDYFRLKARGIATLHDGTPLANSAAQKILNTKRSFDGFVRPATPRQSRDLSTPRSVPAKATAPEIDDGFNNQAEDIEEIKARARAVMSERKNSGQKRSYDDDDEDLFARAKRIREQMEEGENYYKKELEKDSGSRSTS